MAARAQDARHRQRRQAELERRREHDHPQEVRVAFDRRLARIPHHPLARGEMAREAEGDEAVVHQVAAEVVEQGEPEDRGDRDRHRGAVRRVAAQRGPDALPGTQRPAQHALQQQEHSAGQPQALREPEIPGAVRERVLEDGQQHGHQPRGDGGEREQALARFVGAHRARTRLPVTVRRPSTPVSSAALRGSLDARTD